MPLLSLRQDICVHSALTCNVTSDKPLPRLRIIVYCASDYVTYYGMSHWQRCQWGSHCAWAQYGKGALMPFCSPWTDNKNADNYSYRTLLARYWDWAETHLWLSLTSLPLIESQLTEFVSDNNFIIIECVISNICYLWVYCFLTPI